MQNTAACAQKQGNGGKTRDYYFDNLKALLIFLVIAVHLLAAIRGVHGGNPVADGLLTVPCSFHMPLFMMISGYFSKSVKRGRITDSILVYLSAQVLFFFYHLIFTNHGSLSAMNLVDAIAPGFSMWYLASLILLRLFYRELAGAKHGLIVLSLASVAVMSSKMETGLEEVAVKTIANALFFVIGMKLSPASLEKIRRHPKWMYIAAGGVMIGLIYVVVYGLQWVDMYTLRMIMIRQLSVKEMGFGLIGYLIYGVIIVVALFMSVVVMGLIPTRKTCFSIFGKNSVTVYIGQAFVYLAFHALVTRMPQIPVAVLYIGVLILSIATLALFGNNMVAGWFGQWIEFLKKKLFVGSLFDSDNQ